MSWRFVQRAESRLSNLAKKQVVRQGFLPLLRRLQRILSNCMIDSIQNFRSWGFWLQCTAYWRSSCCFISSSKSFKKEWSLDSHWNLFFKNFYGDQSAALFEKINFKSLQHQIWKKNKSISLFHIWNDPIGFQVTRSIWVKDRIFAVFYIWNCVKKLDIHDSRDFK